jgi:hypothetical protein
MADDQPQKKKSKIKAKKAPKVIDVEKSVKNVQKITGGKGKKKKKKSKNLNLTLG